MVGVAEVQSSYLRNIVSKFRYKKLWSTYVNMHICFKILTNSIQ